MRALFLFLPLCAALSLLPVQAQAQQPGYGQAELDALLAPVALYPDDVVRLVLDASTAPGEVAEAAQWSRVNRGMTGEDAVRAVQEYPWQPSVKALLAYPDLLERMAESPQWTVDLGNAWREQQPNVMATVQALRQRAYASGTLRSDAYQSVQSSTEGITVVPAMPYLYNVPYYDPLVVYGGWWWPAYRPVFWRPWTPRPVFVTNVVVVNRGFRAPAAFPHQRSAPAAQFQHRGPPRVQVLPFHRVPESQRQPFVQSRGQPFVQSHAGAAFPQQRQFTQAPAFAAHQQFRQAGGSRQNGPHAQHRSRS